MAGQTWAWLGLCALALGGCSGGEQAPGSGIMMDKGGSGGMGGAAGSLAIELPKGGGGATGTGATGTGATGTGASGGAPTVALHTCPTEPDPPCPAQALAASAVIDSPDQAMALQGVTHIMGDLDIGKPLGLDALSCLETVDGELVIDLFGERDQGTLWGLRNLKEVGETIEVSAGSANLYVDCGFSRLTSSGADYFTGGAIDVSGPVTGELDLSQVKTIKHMRIKGSQLSKVTLPSNATLIDGQLAFDGNSKLAEVAGFTSITLTPDPITVQGAYSVHIVGNPLLSECRAQELAQVYRGVGNSEETITIMNNLPCPM